MVDLTNCGVGVLKRITEYFAAKPTRAADIVVVLVVALLIVVAGNLFQLLNLGRYFGQPEQPYPSETTPLSLVNNGIRWDHPIWSFQKASYNKTKFFWRTGTEGWGGPLASDLDQAILSSGSSVTVVREIGSRPTQYSVNLTIYESSGDGMLDAGDYVIFSGPPLQNDVTQTIALAFVGGPDEGWVIWEVSYAIHDGKFYSWSSHTVGTEEFW
ncbi:MAG: hypothetical protein QXU73_01460 [Thermoplasmata archaeon]